MSAEVEEAAVLPVHFCILIHGLWGNPSHLERVADALRKKHPSEDGFHILVAKSNSGNWTYDGIETGSERVVHEIEGEIKALQEDGKRKVTKMSIVGYSLGGLLARYVVGLLHSKQFFEEIKPVNFTTFATPHIGTRTPSIGWQNQVWNNIASRTLSVSGQQLFLTDKFRDTGRPLLAVLADTSSTFMRGLARFKHRNLYANIVNDRAVPFHTAYICAHDPFTNLDAININYEPGYEDVILDSNRPATIRPGALSFYEALATNSRNFVSKVPFYIAFGAIVPFGSLAYLINSGIQSYQSALRIRDHEEGKAGTDYTRYRLPFMVEEIKKQADAAIESLNTAEDKEYIDVPARNTIDTASAGSSNHEPDSVKSAEMITKNTETALMKQGGPLEGFPTLALTEEQFDMVRNLDALGFEKYAVHIQKARHSHAAIIIRMAWSSFSEGHIVSKHWLERFEA